MRVLLSIIGAFIILSSQAYAGDYMLTVCSDPAYNAQKPRSSSWPVVTAREVKSDIDLFASGGDPQGIFKAAFTNGHVDFCSRSDQISVRRSLLQAIMVAKKERVNDLTHFFMSSGKYSQAAALIDSALSQKNLSQSARTRLHKVRAQVSKHTRKTK